MSKKLFTGLAPLVAIAAFVVLPAAAQAAPHYRLSNTITGEGVSTPILAWGTLTLTAEPPAAPPTTCENSAGGEVENPVGGGAGVGETDRFMSWDCVNAGCPPGEVEIGGEKFEKEFNVYPEQQSLPWPNVLTDVEGVTKIRSESKGVVVTLGCYAHRTHRGAAGPPPAPGYYEEIFLATPTVCITDATHFQEPLNEPGKNSTVTSKLAFDAKAGALSCAGGAVAGKTSGKLKVMAYKESELITTTDP